MVMVMMMTMVMTMVMMLVMMVIMIQSAMMMIALHYNDSDKRDVPKMQCAVPMMVMMGMVHSAMMI